MPTARRSWLRDWRRVGKAEVDMEVAEVDVELDADSRGETGGGERGGGGGGEGGEGGGG